VLEAPVAELLPYIFAADRFCAVSCYDFC